MKIIKQSWRFETGVDGAALLRQIETAGRTCYKSEESPATAPANTVEDFCVKLIRSGHHSVLEHAVVSVHIITDLGVSHEIVRHRLASYSQESTRFCNYSQGRFGNEITTILPVWLYEDQRTRNEDPSKRLLEFDTWGETMEGAEDRYLALLSMGWSPQEARSVLPNSLKTELVMTCNIREWRHFFTLRCSPKAHPQMRELAMSMLLGFQYTIPVLFDDIDPK